MKVRTTFYPFNFKQRTILPERIFFDKFYNHGNNVTSMIPNHPLASIVHNPNILWNPIMLYIIHYDDKNADSEYNKYNNATAPHIKYTL